MSSTPHTQNHDVDGITKKGFTMTDFEKAVVERLDTMSRALVWIAVMLVAIGFLAVRFVYTIHGVTP